MKKERKKYGGMEQLGVVPGAVASISVKHCQADVEGQQQQEPSTQQSNRGSASRYPRKNDIFTKTADSSSGVGSPISSDAKEMKKGKKRKKTMERRKNDGPSTVLGAQAPTPASGPIINDSSRKPKTAIQTQDEVTSVGFSSNPAGRTKGFGLDASSSPAKKSPPQQPNRGTSSNETTAAGDGGRVRVGDATYSRDMVLSSPPKERRRKGKTHGKKTCEPVAEATMTVGSGDAGMNANPSLPLPSGLGVGKPRIRTLSIAIPGSVVDNAQTRELKTYLVGEIARAAAIFEVDEIVVYDDLSVSRKGNGGVRDDSCTNGSSLTGIAGKGGGEGGGMFTAGRGSGHHDRNNPNVFMARLLQYAETPQYLRKMLFPMHSSLRLAGLLNPLDAPHHMREVDDESPFREGVVVERNAKEGAGAFVDIGKRKEARIDRPLAPGVRVTVKLDKGDPCKRNHKGRAVAPSVPREELGLYWGYQTRLASGMADVLAGSPFKGGYDLTLGTSERGTVTVDDVGFTLPPYRHALVVFGGVQGIEATVDADETLLLPGSDASALFDMWVNTCPGQGSRTIRTEEAVLITLARLRAHVLRGRG